MSRIDAARKRLPEYRIWCGLINRCENKNELSYPRYGGRGIVVCQRWRDSFPAFLEDMGTRPSAVHQIDRIDNDGPYSPENCRWATLYEQANNKSNNIRLTFRGQTKTLPEWARALGLRANTLRQRLYNGWDTETLLSTPVLSRSDVTAKRHAAWAATATGTRKLTETNVARIKRLLLSGSTRGQAARLFGVAKATVRAIDMGRTWKHVTPEAGELLLDAGTLPKEMCS